MFVNKKIIITLSFITLFISCAPKKNAKSSAQVLPGQKVEHYGFEWHLNFDEALAVAKAEDKTVFLYFTGSDWCPPCFKMAEEIYESGVFYSQLKDELVFVYADFPRYTPLSESQRHHNEALQKTYRPPGFPTVFFIGQEGNVLLRSGYLPIGAEQYVAMIKSSLGL